MNWENKIFKIVAGGIVGFAILYCLFYLFVWAFTAA